MKAWFCLLAFGAMSLGSWSWELRAADANFDSFLKSKGELPSGACGNFNAPKILPGMKQNLGELVGEPAPDFSLKDVKTGKEISSASLKGKVYVLEFWATWCPPCRETGPFITRWQKDHKEVPVIGVSDEDPKLIADHALKEKLGYLLATDPKQKIQEKYPSPMLPSFVLIDKKGFVVAVTDSSGLSPFLEQALKLAH